MVHSKDARSEALQTVGAEIIVGDLLDINTVVAAMKLSMPPILFGRCSQVLFMPP